MLAADNRLSAELEADLTQLEAFDAPLAMWRQKIRSGALQVIAVYCERARVGSVLWRLESHGGRPCFVIAGAVAHSEKFDLAGAALSELEAFARQIGCRLVRFHTRRRGLIARALELGYAPAEYVMLREVAA